MLISYFKVHIQSHVFNVNEVFWCHQPWQPILDEFQIIHTVRAIDNKLTTNTDVDIFLVDFDKCSTEI